MEVPNPTDDGRLATTETRGKGRIVRIVATPEAWEKRWINWQIRQLLRRKKIVKKMPGGHPLIPCPEEHRCPHDPKL